MDTRRPLEGVTRLVRVGLLAGSTLALGLGAHASAGGTLPGAPALLVLGVGVFVAGLALTGIRLRPAAMLAVVSLGQALLHEALVATTSAAGGLLVVGHHGAAAVSSAQAGSADGGSAAGGSAVMLLGHAAATVATAWLLARGEQALWQAARALAPRLPGVAHTPAPVACRPAIGQVWRAARRDERRAAPARAPPAVLPA